MKSLASDNYAGVLPEVMEALQKANQGHARSYGADEITKRTTDLFRKVFNKNVDVYFVYNGTGANVLSISSGIHSFNSVLCADTSHFYNDESSAPETFTGCRFFPVIANEDGKLQSGAVMERLIRKGDVHYAQPQILTVSQSTEYGTIYTVEELRQLGTLCRNNNLYFHVDGSRFFNAVASLQSSLAEITEYIDVLSLGGTKAGMMFGESVVVFNEKLKMHIAFKQKQVMQLHSKTRFISAQFEAMLTDELWKRTASHANAMARLLHQLLKEFTQIKITKPVQANVVFAEIPIEWNESLMNTTFFYVWKEPVNEVRLMCAWDTTEEDIFNFIKAIKTLIA